MGIRVTRGTVVSSGPNTANLRVTEANVRAAGPVPTGNANVTQENLAVMGPIPANGRVTQEVLVIMGPYPLSLAVTPSSATITTLGGTQAFIATATLSDGSSVNVTTSSAWTSSAPGVATVGAATGVATAVGNGSTTITAAYAGLTASGALTVAIPNTLVSITVTPDPATIYQGQTQTYTAIGHYSDGSTSDITGSVVWSTASPSIATISAGGVATGVGNGTTTVTATQGMVSGSATLNVIGLDSIVVTPPTATINLGQTQPYTAIAHFHDGSTQDITTIAVWTSSATAIATIDTLGVAHSQGGGTTTITATYTGLSGTASLTVLASLIITPLNPVIQDGQTQQFVAIADFGTGGQLDVTTTASWSSSLIGVATIGLHTGLAQSVAGGVTVISATYSGLTASTNLTVTDAQLVSLAVYPIDPTQAVGLTLQFAAIGTYSDGSTQDLTQIVNWSSGTPTIATIALHGLASALAVGATLITASTGSLSASTTLTVISATVIGYTIIPQDPVVTVGTLQPFQSIELFSDGSSQDVTLSSFWSSSDVTVSTIVSGTGVATAQVPGVTIITALVNSVSVTTLMTVIQPVLEAIIVLPANPVIPYPGSQQFIAVGVYSDGTQVNITDQVEWSSSDLAIATIDINTGFAVAVHSGQTHIVATQGNLSGSTILTVVAALLTITVIPPHSLVTVGGEVQLEAIGAYNDGSTADITQQVTWSVDKPTAASVLIGLVTGKSLGEVLVTAALAGVSGTAIVDVIQMPPYEDPTLVQFRSHITQAMQNYFDKRDVRSREQKYELGAQLLNVAAMQLEQSSLRLYRESSSRLLATAPGGLDNQGVYYSARLANSFHVNPDATLLNGAIGRVAGRDDALLYPFNDLLPIPARLEADPAIAPVAMSNPLLFSFTGAGDDRTQIFAIHKAENVAVAFPGRLHFYLDQFDELNVDLDILIEGETHPRPVWQRERGKTSESIRMSRGYARSAQRWSLIDRVTVRGLPTGARLQAWTLGFNMPAVFDQERPYTDPSDRDVLYPRYWQVSTNGLVLREMFLDRGGLEYIQSYRSGAPILGVAVEPRTWGMYVATPQAILYVDRRERLPIHLDAAAIQREPIYGLNVEYDVVKSTDGLRWVRLEPLGYARASTLALHRWLVQGPDGELLILTKDGLLPYSGGAGWRRGKPVEMSAALPLDGEDPQDCTYVFSLECMDNQGTITTDGYPYPNFRLNPANRAGRDVFFPVAGIAPQVKGLAFDDNGRLWLWTGTYAVALKAHYDAYILDATARTIYLTDVYDVVDVT